MKTSTTPKNTISQNDSHVLKTLTEVQQKVNASPVLNGGFDKLLYKVDKIELTLNEIHTAIYNPDEGLFSRIAGDKALIDKQFIEMNAWRDGIDKNLENKNSCTEKLLNTISEQQKKIDELAQWKKIVSTLIGWIGSAFGSAIIILIFKFVYDYMILHWK
jgi:chaperonin cofactor prefoldin